MSTSTNRSGPDSKAQRSRISRRKLILAQCASCEKARTEPVHSIVWLSEGDDRLRIARFERIHISEDEVARAIAVEGFFVVLAHNGEGVEDVADIVAVSNVVEQEIKRIEPRTQMRAFLLVPRERRQHLAGLAAD